MPISDYASAFFFARRNRVTLQDIRTEPHDRDCNFKSVAARSGDQYRRGLKSSQPEVIAVVEASGSRLAASRQEQCVMAQGLAEVGGARCNKHQKKKPGAAGLLTKYFSASLFRELCDLMREPRDLPARIVLVNDIALGCLHQLRLGARHRFQRGIAVAALDRLFDDADRAAHLGAARLVDDGAAGNLACRLLGGSRIGHVSNILAVTGRGES